MSVKICFYCKTKITKVEQTDGTILYVNEDPSPSSSLKVSRDTQTFEETEREDEDEVVVFRSDSASVAENLNEINEINE